MKDNLLEILKAMNWKEQLGHARNITNFSKNFANGIVAAAKEFNVPKYRIRTGKRSQEDQSIIQLTKRHNKLSDELHNKALKKSDKQVKTELLKEVNP